MWISPGVIDQTKIGIQRVPYGSITEIWQKLALFYQTHRQKRASPREPLSNEQ
jgi:hypothetical protein